MSMSDESFFREVNEDLRAERMRGFWNRFGWMIITAVVLIILATAAFVAYEYWQDRRAARSGDAFLQALTLAREGETEQAMTALQELQETGVGAYPVLARMRGATLSAEAGNFGEAIDAFTAIGEDGSVPQALREAAKVRAAYLLVDHGSYEDVEAVVGDMATADHPMRHSAREALGLAAWEAGDVETAKARFEEIASDAAAVPGFSERAGVMLDLMTAGAVPGEAPPEASAPPAEQEGAEGAAPVDLQSIAPALAPSIGQPAAAPEGEGQNAPAGETEPQTAPGAPETVPLESLQGDEAPASEDGS